jgi:spore maturation protein A
MNKIWTIIALTSVAVLIYLEPANIIGYMNKAANDAVMLTIKLAALYTVWMGIMQIAEKAGITNKLAALLGPVIRFLFGDIDDKTAKFISINMSANIIGIGTAATPAGISAIQCMDKGSETATDNMIMLLVINSTSMQLIPTTIISLRQSFESAAPSDIIIPTLIATLTSTLFAVMLVKIFRNFGKKSLIQVRKPLVLIS